MSSKRMKEVATIVLSTPDQITEYEDVEKIEFKFPLDTSLLGQIQNNCIFWPWLKELHIVPEFNDNQIFSLDLSNQNFKFPSLEKLSIRNQAVPAIQINSTKYPMLQSFKLSHPLGIPITKFEIYLPDTLKEIELEYMTITDGKGLFMSLNENINRSLISVKKFGLSVRYCGIN